MGQISTGAASDDRAIVAALRNRDEAAFAALVGRHHAMLIRIARLYVSDDAVAEEVAQETWLALLSGIDAFEERSSLKTWLVRVVENRARTRGARDRRMVPFADLAAREAGELDPAVSADHFRGATDMAPGHWAVPPRSWGSDPERDLLDAEAREIVQAAMAALPDAQREVMTLRDVEGWSAEEVCNALGITETNHRVLLHRARSKVRRALERYYHDD